MKQPKDRFYLLNPEEREALRVLVQNHINSVSEISLHKQFRVTGYIDYLERLEYELIHHELPQSDDTPLILDEQVKKVAEINCALQTKLQETEDNLYKKMRVLRADNEAMRRVVEAAKNIHLDWDDEDVSAEEAFVTAMQEYELSR